MEGCVSLYCVCQAEAGVSWTAPGWWVHRSHDVVFTIVACVYAPSFPNPGDSGIKCFMPLPFLILVIAGSSAL